MELRLAKEVDESVPLLRGPPPPPQPPAARAGPALAAPPAHGAPSTMAASDQEEVSPCLPAQKQPARGMWGLQRRVSLDALMVVWGLGTWLGVNGLYVQLPVLVRRLPEGWALPASMALAIQLANVGILVYALLRRLLPRAPDAPYVCALLGLGSLALATNAFVYERTAWLAGAPRSLPFLALTFCAALVGCTSSVLFYPYLRHFRDAYLATYLVGEGLSGFLPSVLALAQGVGGEPACVPDPAHDGGLVAVHPEPRFSSTVFLLVLAALSACSLLAFALIDSLRTFLPERAPAAAAAKDEESRAPRAALLTPRWLAVLLLVATLNALSNGVMPSIQSYSCIPYGNRSYHLAVTLSAMANPVACLCGVWLAPVRARTLGAALLAALAPLSWMLATALLSPSPPLAGSAGGSALVVCCWVGVSGVVSYARMWLYGWARAGGARGMRAAGAATQLGSALGSALLLLLVTYTQLFTQSPDCPTAPAPPPPLLNVTAALSAPSR